MSTRHYKHADQDELTSSEMENSNGSAEEVTSLLKAPDEAKWTPAHVFIWIELAIFVNQLFYGFDGPVTAFKFAVINSEFDAANTG